MNINDLTVHFAKVQNLINELTRQYQDADAAQIKEMYLGGGNFTFTSDVSRASSAAIQDLKNWIKEGSTPQERLVRLEEAELLAQEVMALALDLEVKKKKLDVLIYVKYHKTKSQQSHFILERTLIEFDIRAEKRKEEEAERQERYRKQAEDRENARKKREEEARSRYSSSGSGGYSGRSYSSTGMSKKDLAIVDLNKYLVANGFEILALNPDNKQIRKAQMSLVRKFHPDVNPGVDESILKTVNSLFDVIK